MTSSSILLQLTRGPLVESVHRGHIAVCHTDGRILYAAGNPEVVTFARSSMKPIQAIAVVESGAADRYSFTPKEIAILCASHNGEEAHIDTVQGMLTKLGFSEADLECGPHDPYYKPAADRIKQSGGSPTALHNNCSGKHTGMLALARMLEVAPGGYLSPEHPVQRRMLSVVSAMSGLAEDQIHLGIDGCGVPVFGLPLASLAAAFARFGRLYEEPALAEGGPARAEAAARILAALRQHPFQLAGTGRFDTRLIEVTQGRLIGKMGAEGVFALTAPDRGMGLAVKIEDGADRAIYPAVTEALLQLGWLSESEAAQLAEFHRPVLHNWKGTSVGQIIPVLKLNPYEA